MRLSQFFFISLRETPAEADLIGHQFLLRGGFIRRLSSGIYHYLPLAFRSLNKIIHIVREEMNRAGAQEVLLPVLHPAELWQETGRWDQYGELLMRLTDRQGRDFCLGPTHEEVIVDLVRRSVRSYRQLPFNLYQIATKFRDELRPRGGLIRAREFLMKDAYSFDRDEAGLEISFQKMKEAYERIFCRCGLNAIVVEAEAGAIGGTDNLEFMVPYPEGEDRLLQCHQCGYAANRERAQRSPSPSFQEALQATVNCPTLEKVFTPQQKTVEQVSGFLGVAPCQLVKTLLYDADGQLVAALVPGDKELNEAKLQRFLGQPVKMADAHAIQTVTGASVGYSGPVGLSEKGVRMIADYDVALMSDFVVGANEDDHHFIHTDWRRDFSIDDFADLRFAEAGDLCPKCQSPLSEERAIEVGHIFKLGTYYSEPMRATFVDESGQERPFVMGCYGIGISRILATVAETYSDRDGLIFPITIAPFECWLMSVEGEGELVAVAEELYHHLLSARIEVAYDDRLESAGVKFKDMDLVGAPIQVIVGRHYRAEQKVEIRLRERRDQPVLVPVQKVREEVSRLRSELYQRLDPDKG
ncbi:MAG: proline--tRNA ligase [Armatimonadetes bacterium]|nr:proline--tRNA ligase [Armatimonadota bacterium]MDW8122042.1 proline--tRNA ligase [Armatimonadota bacterium]